MNEYLTIFDFLEETPLTRLRRLRVCRECKCKPVLSSARGIVCPICGKAEKDDETWNEVNR